MAKHLMFVIGIGMLCGIAAELVRGDGVGKGIGMLVAVVGTVVAVLVRNQRDLAELQYGQAPPPRSTAR